MSHLLILMFLLASCTTTKMNSEFKPFVEEFEKRFDTKVYTKIKFNNYSHSTRIGLCDPWENLVFIDKGYWMNTNYFKRRELIYHELGHCHFLFLHHNDDKDENRCFKSIMASSMDSTNCLIRNWDKKLELFRKRRK